MTQEQAADQWDPIGRHRTSRRRRGLAPVRMAVRIVAAGVSLSLLVGAGYLRHTYDSLDRGLHRVAVGGLGQAPAPATGARLQHIDGAAQNLLVIGDDDRSGLTPRQIATLHVGAADATTSTDTLMVVHVPANGAKATLISIPRDSYVAIPGFRNDKINAAYIDGYTYGTAGYPVTASSSVAQRQAAGLTLLVRVVKNLTGLTIDHYVLVNFLGFYNIAVAIRGVTVDLCHAVDDSPARNRAQGLGGVGSGFVESAGVHHLTPTESLEFVRQRHNLFDGHGHELNDIGREARQRYFLAAAFARIERAGTLLNPGKLNALVAAIKSTLTIDSGLSLDSLAHQLLDLTGGNIVGQTIPTQGSRTFPSPVGDALVVDPVQVQDRISRWLNPPAPSTPSSSTPAGSSAAPGGATRTPAGGVAAAAHGCVN
ncbi:LCP family protein [uncultured Jatrophihabitans sp.]|uniref:LCP family protein n=1 Tax=uncultured Jatrophihabitans sp. TaxID=1610747 RepID=UPI0035CBE3EE